MSEINVGIPHVGDVGFTFEASVQDEDGVIVDLSLAQSITFNFQKPDDTMMVKAASLRTDGSDGIVKYITTEGDLDQDGTWKDQVFVEIGISKFHTDILKFKVLPNLPI